MSNILFKIKTVANPKLTDGAIVEESMNNLMAEYPQIAGYMWERCEDGSINVLMWGNIAAPADKGGMRP